MKKLLSILLSILILGNTAVLPVKADVQLAFFDQFVAPSDMKVEGDSDMQGNISVTGTSDFQDTISNSTGDLSLDDGVIINDSQANVDFRVESDNNENAFFVDASSDFVGVRTNSPGQAFDVESATSIQLEMNQQGSSNELNFGSGTTYASFKVGNNGGTQAATITHSNGYMNVGGDTDPSANFTVGSDDSGADNSDGAGDMYVQNDIEADGSYYTGDQGDMRFNDADSSNYAAIQAPATITTDYTLTLPANDGDADQVLTTDGSGNLTWNTPSSIFESNSNVVSTNNNHYDDDFVFGSPQLIDDGNSDHDSRMYFDKSRSAFRVGKATGTEWNSTGLYSVAMGNNTIATGNYSTALGRSASASGDYSMATGQNSNAYGNYSMALGPVTTAQSFGETVIGRWNTTYVPSSTTNWVDTDRLFVIGNGASSASDALVMYKNGNTELYASFLAEDITAENITAGKDGTDGLLVIYNDGPTDYTTTIQSNASQTESYNLILPADNGDTDQVLKTDGSGNLDWVDQTVDTDNQDFEDVYSNDTGNDLNTSNSAFTVTTGTGDFIVDSNDWNVDATGALDATGNITTTGGDIVIGTVGLSSTASPTTSGAYKIGVNDEFDHSSSTTVQAVLNDFDEAITTVGLPSGVLNQTLRYGSSGWESSGAIVNDGTDVDMIGDVHAHGQYIAGPSGVPITNATTGFILDSALTDTITKLGNSIDLSSEVTGTLPGSSVGTGINGNNITSGEIADAYINNALTIADGNIYNTDFSVNAGAGNTAEGALKFNTTTDELYIGNGTSFTTVDTDVSDDFSGSFNDLTNVPVNLDTDSTDDFSGDFNDLTNVPVNLDTDSTDDLNNAVDDTTPQLGGMLDVNGYALGDGTNELLKFAETGSAVNELTIINAGTGNSPTIAASGDDTNIDITLAPKGTGSVMAGLNVMLDESNATTVLDNWDHDSSDDLLESAIGDTVQAKDDDLDIYASITPSANVQTLLSSTNYDAFKTYLTLNNVENTALSTWTGSSSIDTVGSIGTGTWQGAEINDLYVSNNLTITNGSISGTDITVKAGATGNTADGRLVFNTTTDELYIGDGTSFTTVDTDVSDDFDGQASSLTGTVSNAQVADDLTIDGGTIDDTVIGGTTPANGSFIQLSSSGGTTLGGTVDEDVQMNVAGSGVVGIDIQGTGAFNVEDNGVAAFTVDQYGDTTAKNDFDVDGVITAGSGNIAITNATGNVLGSAVTGNITGNAANVTGIVANANVAEDLTIDGGTIDDTVIGGTTPSSAEFTSLEAGQITVNSDANAQTSGTGSVSAWSDIVTGTSTAFTTEYNIGDIIVAGGNIPRMITGITSNTSLTVDKAFMTAGSGLNLYRYPASFISNDDSGNVISSASEKGIFSSDAYARNLESDYAYIENLNVTSEGGDGNLIVADSGSNNILEAGGFSLELTANPSVGRDINFVENQNGSSSGVNDIVNMKAYEATPSTGFGVSFSLEATKYNSSYWDTQDFAKIGSSLEGASNGTTLSFSNNNGSGLVEQMTIDSNGNTNINGSVSADDVIIDGPTAQADMAEVTTPATPASGYGRMFVDSADSKLKFIDDGGTTYDLTAGAGSIPSFIVQDDSSVEITDSGSNGTITFTTDSSAVGAVDNTGDWFFGGGDVTVADHVLDSDGSAKFNEQGAAANFTVESDTEAEALNIVGASNEVTLGSTTVASADIVMDATDGGATFNQQGTSTGDVTIEGDTDADLFVTDASADAVGIGTNAPDTKVHIAEDGYQMLTLEDEHNGVDPSVGGAITWKGNDDNANSETIGDFSLVMNNRTDGMETTAAAIALFDGASGLTNEVATWDSAGNASVTGTMMANNGFTTPLGTYNTDSGYMSPEQTVNYYGSHTTAVSGDANNTHIQSLTGSTPTYTTGNSSDLILDPSGGETIIDDNLFVGATSVSGVKSSFVANGDDIYAAGDIAAQYDMYADSFVAGDASTTFGDGEVSTASNFNLKASGDADDYLVMKTSGNVPTISTAGSADLNVTSSGTVRIGPESSNSTSAVKITDVDGSTYVNFDSSNQRMGIGNTAPDTKLHVTEADSGTDTILYSAKLTHNTSGTAATNFGTGIEFEGEDASGNDETIGTLGFRWNSATNGSETGEFFLINQYGPGGGTQETMTVDEVGNTTISGDFYAPNGITAGGALGTDSVIYTTEMTAPSTPSSGMGVIYSKSSDSKLYYKSDAGTEYDLTATGGGGSGTSIEDGDSDTKVQTDETGLDDDAIRFDTAGSERMVIDNTGHIFIGENASPQSYAQIFIQDQDSGSTALDLRSLYVNNQNNFNTSGTSTNYGGYFVADGKQSGSGNLENIALYASTSNGTTNKALVTNNGEVVLNESGDANADTRIEGDTDTDLFFVDASANRVGISTNTPSNVFEVDDYIVFDPTYSTTQIGYNANASNNAGAYNVAVGYQPLYSGTAASINNIGIGYNAGYYNSSGDYNTFVGHSANQGASGYSVSHVTAMGNTALRDNRGNYNTAVGSQAFMYNQGGYGNTGVGHQAGYNQETGNYNSLLGYQAQRGGNTANPSYGVAVGYQAAYLNESDNITAIGSNALDSNTTGQDNVAVGSETLQAVSTGSHNTAVGRSAAYTTTGSYNTAMGKNSLLYNNTGDYNTALGYEAVRGQSGYAPYGNTGIGRGALLNVRSVSYNTAVGYGAGDNITTGQYNVAIGASSDAGTSPSSYNTAIGFNAQAAGGSSGNATAIGNGATTGTNSNYVRIGNTSVSTIGGQVNWSNLSDRTEKENISNYNNGLDFINKLRPVSFNFTSQPTNEYEGFIAQEVEDALGDINNNFSGLKPPQNPSDKYMLSYGQFTVPLATAVQELDLKFGNTLKPDTSGNVKIGLTAPQSVASYGVDSGQMSAGTYYYAIAAVNGTTESDLSTETKTTLDGNPMKSVKLRWAPVAGATSYRVYKGASTGNYTEYFTTSNTEFTDNGSIGTASGTPNASTNPEAIRLSTTGDSWFTGGNFGIGTKTPDAPLAVAGDIKSYGNSFYLDSDNTGAGANVDIIAVQGTDSPGKIRYDANSNSWKLSNDGGAFQEIATKDDITEPSIFYGYDSTPTNLSTTKQVLNIDGIKVNDSDYSFSNDQITFNRDGLYKVTGRITVTSDDKSGDARSSFVLRGEKDNGSGYNLIPGALCGDYIREESAPVILGGSCSITFYENFNAGNKLRLTHQMTGTTTARTVQNGSGLTIEFVR